MRPAFTRHVPSPEKLVEAVREIAAEYPDTTYIRDKYDQPCAYTPDERNPMGCIIGAALSRLGVDVTLYPWKDNGAIEEMLDIQGIELSFTTEWLTKIQELQDNGTPWKKAVEEADEALEEGTL